MKSTMKTGLALVALMMSVTPIWAADAPSGEASQVTENAQQTADAIVDAIDKNEQAQIASAGVLEPIYNLAEAVSIPAFHWVAFALMTTAVVSFALQLTLGKLVVLTKFGFSIQEILSDALGLAVSLVGLVLTTQAATENSTFTASATAVLSSATLGIILGVVFYIWGQRQELQAVEGRKRIASKEVKKQQVPA